MVKTTFYSNLETVCNVDNIHNANQVFEIDDVKYQLDEKGLDDLPLHDTSV